jgi:polyisoprenoid-binding protein YceI
MSTYTTPLTGTYVADPIHSSFAFAVKYMGGATFRGTLEKVSAKLEDGPSGSILTGSAEVESISIRHPEPFRAHVLGDDFFAAERHPEITFRSEQITLEEDGTASVDGELTIKGIGQAVSASGSWTPPVADPSGKTRANISLETVVSRRDYGIVWDVRMPGGDPALADEVTITVDLFLVAQDQG